MSHEFKPDTGSSDEYCKCGLHKSHSDHDHAAATATLSLPPDMERSDLSHRIEALLSEVGSFAQCKGCLQPIYWVTTNSKRQVAYNLDGTVHFNTCRNQAEFARQKGPKQNG